MAKTLEEFVSETEFAGGNIERLAGDASARRYARASIGEKTAMVMDTPPEGENFPAFVHIAEHLLGSGYSAPKIMARDMQNGFLLLEDFGSNSFSAILANNGVNEEKLYTAAIDLLAEWQNLPEINIPAYNAEVYLREASLFPDWFLPQVLGAEKAKDLRAEYMRIWDGILNEAKLSQNIFVHRDFHADNLMWLPARECTERVGLLDFQDALMGDGAYDVVSLLEDARRDVPPKLAEKMIIRYVQKTGLDEETFRTSYSILGAQRNSKIIGIFWRLCLRDGKDGYLRFLPRVWAHLSRDLQHPALAPLKNWLDRNIPMELRK